MKKVNKVCSELLENGSGGVFRIYKERSKIGYKILNDLLPKRDGIYTKNGIQYRGFYLNDKDRTVGLLSQLYGSSGLFTLINRFNVLSGINDESIDTDGLVSGIISTLLDVLDYVEDNNYDMNPLIDSDLKDRKSVV